MKLGVVVNLSITPHCVNFHYYLLYQQPMSSVAQLTSHIHVIAGGVRDVELTRLTQETLKIDDSC